MSLQGTLETIPLPDVLALLAATKKTGELRITSERGDGRLWLDAGRVVGADVDRAASPADAVFELLRLAAGTFSFGDGSPETAGQPVAVEALLAEAQERLAVWVEIEAVVPSTACAVGLAPEVAGDAVTVSRQQWKELVAVVSGPDVAGAMKALGVGEFDACRIVKELADAGLVKVGAAPPAPVRAPEAAPSAKPARRDPAADGAARTAPAPAPRQAAPPPAPAATSTPPPARRLAPGPVPARSAAPGPTPSPATQAPGRAPAEPAAPAAAANGGRSAAPARPATGGAALDENEELVQQLATLGGAPAKTVPASAEPAPTAATAEADEDTPKPAPAGDQEGAQIAGGDGDEPINRGMLLKFLSSVRS